LTSHLVVVCFFAKESLYHIKEGTMKRTQSFRTFCCVFLLSLCLLLTFAFSSSGYAATTLWIEDFEGYDWSDFWHADYGTWEVGTPANVGPASAHSPVKCAATVIAGNYSEGVDSRFIRHVSFVVPAASENPRLRFWHWYSFNCSDFGTVQIKPNGGSWVSISEPYYWYSSGLWTRPCLDLTAYAGQTVQVAFYFHSENNGSSGCGYGSVDVDAGWYVDDVTVETGTPALPDPEDWEGGLGDWGVSRGTWEVGTPTSGPGSCYSGTQCAATRLDGNYYEAVDSRLTSPPFVVPAASENPRLRFYHWYSTNCSDFGTVQIKPDGGSWVNISEPYYWYSSGVWTRPYLDLTAYAGQTVQVAFYFHSENNGSSGCGYGSWDTDAGWYVDDVIVETGDVVLRHPEDWEGGLGDWGVSRGTWEVGTPTSGPGSCYSGTQCAATRLGGDYYEAVDSRLTSPPFLVPGAGDQPALRFYHWYSFNCSDYGQVWIKEVSSDTWDPLNEPPYTGTSSDVWTQPYLPLTDYAGQTVQVAFYFHSENNGSSGCGYGNWDVAPGWYIDNIEIPGQQNECLDQDQDGYGSPASEFCLYPKFDCNDNDKSVYPGAREICDCKDNQCPGDPGYGEIDEGGVCPACPDPCAATAEASVFESNRVYHSADPLMFFIYLMIPIGAFVLVRIRRRKR
jgi:Putative metal-binding motif